MQPHPALSKGEGNSHENLNMKLSILFLFVFAIIGSTYASGDKRLEFSVKEASRDTLHPEVASVTLELKNLTDDTLVFLTMRCNRFSSLLSIDGSHVFLDSHRFDCDKNGPIFIKLRPHDSYRETIKVWGEKEDTIIPVFRIRIDLTEPKEKYDYIAAMHEKDPKHFSLLTDYINIK